MFMNNTYESSECASCDKCIFLSLGFGFVFQMTNRKCLLEDILS